MRSICKPRIGLISLVVLQARHVSVATAAEVRCPHLLLAAVKRLGVLFDEAVDFLDEDSFGGVGSQAFHNKIGI